jgi:hypothetical protein
MAPLREAAEMQPVNGITKKYKGVGLGMATLRAEMKVLRRSDSARHSPLFYAHDFSGHQSFCRADAF